ncbi:MATE family efflux transporter [Chromatiales bacterium (ex Bugula neritina AB1)]|nr:MATE family efflux transporter [Chromatiales bacterium (ex Bugula neritina AB1)]
METTHRDLTTGSIYRHLISLSIPAAMGLIFNTLYNLTDFWFAGLLSDQALAGVSIAGSVFFLVISLGAGMQNGTTAIIANEVGKGNVKDAKYWLDQAAGLGIVVSIISMIIGLLASDYLIRFLGAEPEIAPFAERYITIVFIGNIAFVIAAVAAGALMALGDTKSNRNALMMGFFANFALNPLLTFTLGLGVTGLALSTVLIKLLTSLYLLYVLKKYLGSWCRPAFDFVYWKDLLRQVVPASLNMLTIILGGFITVSFIGRFGSEHVAGYAIGLRLEQVLLLPALGLFTAVMALVGQNHGAGFHDRVQSSYKSALLIGLAMAIVSIPVMVLFSPIMISFFSTNANIIGTGSTYLRIDAIAFYGYVVLFIGVASLQAIKQPIFPMILGIARQLVIPALINYYLIVTRGLPMVTLFITIVCVVVVSACICHWYTWKQLSVRPAPHSTDRSQAK